MWKKKEINYTHSEFEAGVKQIVNNNRATGTEYSRIVGLVRGGLPLATRLSYILEVPITTITWSTRDFAEKEYNEIVAEDMNNGQKILLVDDIIDSGETIRQVIDTWGNFPEQNLSIACLILNTDQETMPDFFHKTIDRKEEKRWVKFWWESNDVL